MVWNYNKDNYVDINSDEDGNCGLNALSLGFTDLVLGNYLDELAKGNRYNIVIEKLNKIDSTVKDWSSFKKFLTDNKDKPHFIQKTLARIFREITISLQEADSKANGINPSEVNAFKAEFREHLYNKFNLPLNVKNSGDIYKRVDKFVKKFDEEYEDIKQKLETNKLINLEQLFAAVFANITKEKLTEAQDLCYKWFQHETNVKLDQLDKWFKDTGHAIFLENQKKEGTWTGDIELAPLASLLGINIKTIIRDNPVPYEIHNFHGCISRKLLTENQIRLLQDREVIDRKLNSNDLWLSEIDETTLNTKLSSINNEFIVKFWQENKAAISSGHKCYFPDTWLPNFLRLSTEQIGLGNDVFNQLIERQIIAKEEKSDRYVFIKMDLELLLQKMQELDNNEFIVNFWLENSDNICNGIKCYVPDTWVPNMLHLSAEQIGLDYTTFNQLIERGIIARESDRYVFIKMDEARLKDKMQGVDGNDKFIKIWKENYQNPAEIILYNPFSAHWYYKRPKAFTHWNLKDLEVDHSYSNLLSSNLLELLLSNKKNDPNQNAEEDYSLLNDQNEEDPQTAMSQANIMRNLLLEILGDEEEKKKTGSINGDYDSTNMLGTSPRSFNSPLADPSIVSDTANYSEGNIDNLPHIEDDEVAEVQTNSSGYPVVGFFRRQRSPSPSTSPPYPNKKQKQETQQEDQQKQNQAPLQQRLLDSATLALNSLASYTNADNEDIISHANDLMTAFNLIIWSDEIPATYSLQLLLPRTYLSSLGKNVEFLPPKHVLEFIEKNFNQILFAANAHLVEKIKTLYMKISHAGDIIQSVTINLLNKIFKTLTNYLVLTDEARHSIMDFKIAVIDEDLKTTKISLNDIKEIKIMIRNCQLISQQMNIESCAQSILSFPEIGNYPQIKQLFVDVRKFGIDNLDTISLTSLINIDTDKISEKNLGWAISQFINLFQHDIYSAIQNSFKKSMSAH